MDWHGGAVRLLRRRGGELVVSPIGGWDLAVSGLGVWVGAVACGCVGVGGLGSGLLFAVALVLFVVRSNESQIDVPGAWAVSTEHAPEAAFQEGSSLGGYGSILWPEVGCRSTGCMALLGSQVSRPDEGDYRRGAG